MSLRRSPRISRASQAAASVLPFENPDPPFENPEPSETFSPPNADNLNVTIYFGMAGWRVWETKLPAYFYGTVAFERSPDSQDHTMYLNCGFLQAKFRKVFSPWAVLHSYVFVLGCTSDDPPAPFSQFRLKWNNNKRTEGLNDATFEVEFLDIQDDSGSPVLQIRARHHQKWYIAFYKKGPSDYNYQGRLGSSREHGLLHPRLAAYYRERTSTASN